MDGAEEAARREPLRRPPDLVARRREADSAVKKDRRGAAVMAKRRNVVARAAGEAPLLPTPDIVRAFLAAETEAQRVPALVALRKLLAQSEEEPPIADVLAAGCVQMLSVCLQSASEEQQLNAAWCCVNLATGTTEQTLALTPTLAALVQLVSSRAVVAEQAAWALGNIAGDSAELQQRVLAAGAAAPLVTLIGSRSVAASHMAVWALLHLARRATPSGPFAEAGIVPALTQFLDKGVPEADSTADGMWLASFLCGREAAMLHAFVAAGLLPLVMRAWTAYPHAVAPPRLSVPALRILGRACSLPDRPDYTSTVLALPGFFDRLLEALNPAVLGEAVREAAWLCSNLVAGTPEQRLQVANSAVVPAVARLLGMGPSFYVTRECFYTLAFLASDPTYLDAVLDEGGEDLIRTTCQLLAAPEPDAAEIAVRFVDIAVKRRRALAHVIEEMGGRDALDALQYKEPETLAALAGQVYARRFASSSAFAEEEELPPLPEAAYQAAAAASFVPPPAPAAPAPAPVVAGAAAPAPAPSPQKQRTLFDFGFRGGGGSSSSAPPGDGVEEMKS